MKTTDLLCEVDTIIESTPGWMTGIARQSRFAELVTAERDESRAAMRELVEELMGEMLVLEASDIDIGGTGCSGRIWYRVHGVKRPREENGMFTTDQSDVLLLNLLNEQQQRFLMEHRSLDFSYAASYGEQSARFRGHLYFDLDHLALNMRLIKNEIRPFTDLGFHPKAASTLSLVSVKQGLTLVTGITGSGKSATLDSIIDANNRTVAAHVVIIGEPIETVHLPQRCLIRHREVGRDVRSFKEGTIQALRQDPDIIVIGEMRDPDTIMTALEVTDSGHRVYSTLHTGSAVESVDRIIAECPTLEQDRVRRRLADVLTCVISQKLVPSLDGKRVLAKEVLLATSSVRAAIKNNNLGEIYQMVNEGSAEGMITMEQDLWRLWRKGSISKEDALNYSNNKKRLIELIESVLPDDMNHPRWSKMKK